jgi:hypothetical protein
MSSSCLPDASNTTTMDPSWDDNTTYHFNGLQDPNAFAETITDPTVLAYLLTLGLPEPRLFTHPNRATIIETLTPYVSDPELDPITGYLQQYFGTSLRRITGFRAGVVRLLNDEKLWPVVEWREDHDTDVLAIFKVMGPGIPCGCLMHYGEGIAWLERTRWRRSALTWQVTEIGDLCDLFLVAQHSLGMLHWSNEDIVNLYVKDCPENCTDEQYYSP